MAVSYTTQERIERRYGVYRVRGWCDHDDDGEIDSGTITDAIERASEEIRIGIGPSLVDSLGDIREHWATTLAAFYAMRNRVNDEGDSVLAEVEEIRRNFTIDGRQELHDKLVGPYEIVS